ncbi:MAG TPA: LCCL domain-containing protein, partial [Gemmatimonadota bacterium]|nr:LCCL domain-containing protein [Gemmatimonadota bacterium]
SSGWFNPGQAFAVELTFGDGQTARQVVQVTGAAAMPPQQAVTPPPQAGGATPIDWYTGPMAHRGQNGQRFSYFCPPGGSAGPLWGTGTHTDDSSVCTAAVHAGLITFQDGGTVTIEIQPGQTSYTGSPGYGGVTSNNWGAYEGSFMVVGGEGAAPGTPTGAGLPTQDFYAPIWNGLRLDLCLVWGGQCGEPAATEFCRQSGYTRAAAWEPAYDIGAQSPTFVLGTGQVCSEPGCDGFTSITCSQ